MARAIERSRATQLQARRDRADAKALRASLRRGRLTARAIVQRAGETRAWVQATKLVRRARGR